MSVLEFMALQQYELWYKKDVSPNMDKGEKLELAKKISELSLREPIFLPGKKYSHDMFPELAKFSHAEEFTGMQLYAVFTEIMRELGHKLPSASEVALTNRRGLI